VVKVIWQKGHIATAHGWLSHSCTARGRESLYFKTDCPFSPKFPICIGWSVSPSNTVSWAHPSPHLNNVSIDSAVLLMIMTDRPTCRPTDRPRYSISNKGRIHVHSTVMRPKNCSFWRRFFKKIIQPGTATYPSQVFFWNRWRKNYQTQVDTDVDINRNSDWRHLTHRLQQHVNRQSGCLHPARAAVEGQSVTVIQESCWKTREEVEAKEIGRHWPVSAVVVALLLRLRSTSLSVNAQCLHISTQAVYSRVLVRCTSNHLSR